MMISLNISFIQMLVLVVVSLFSLKVIRILVTLLTSSPFFVNWAIKRQANRRNLVEIDKKTQMYKDLQTLTKVIDWIDSNLPTNQKKKQFWKDFSLSKPTRNEWIDKLMAQFEEPKVIKTSIKQKNKTINEKK